MRHLEAGGSTIRIRLLVPTLLFAGSGLATAAQPHPLVEELAAAFREDPAAAERRLWEIARNAPPEPALVDAVGKFGAIGQVAAGVLLRRALRPLDALEAFDRALDHPASHLEAGWLLAKLRLDDRALERFARAPPGPASRHARASLLARNGRAGEALAIVEDMSAGSLLHAELLDSAGRSAEAISLLRETTDNPAAALRLARILLREGNPEEAIRILEMAPEGGETWLVRARALEAAGRDAEDAWRRALEFGRNEARLGLGQLLARSGEREEAERLLAAFQRRKRIADESARLLAEAELRPDDFEAARAFTLHALETAEDPGLALRAAQRFLVERPEDPRRHLLLARVWMEAGSRADAIRALRRGLARFAGEAERFREALAGLDEPLGAPGG